ncbi:hypothetical protein [Mesorhizobium sp.]|uniref:hypothetical protein n=1 Tax=Mesorhizobium sp. TaxID=1871066 RepID=UPI000FE9C014|nr:hypothetical protein [Mesorhizobium sp.]RWN25696.1 MAG: hypothetical protein EOR95_27775 [Mesorhizobium sp.]
MLQRMEHEPPAERIFEADLDTNLRAFGVFQTINDILVQSNRKIIPIETLSNQSSLESIQSVEQKIISKSLQPGGGPTAKRGQGHERLDADASDIDHRSDPKSTRVSAASTAPADIVLPYNEDMGRSFGYASIFALLIYIGGAGLTSLGAAVDCAVARFALQRSLAAATLFGMIRRFDLFLFRYCSQGT